MANPDLQIREGGGGIILGGGLGVHSSKYGIHVYALDFDVGSI